MVAVQFMLVYLWLEWLQYRQIVSHQPIVPPPPDPAPAGRRRDSPPSSLVSF